VSIERLTVESAPSSEFAIYMKSCLNCSVSRTEVRSATEGTGHEWGIGVKRSGFALLSHVTLTGGGILVEGSRAEVSGSLLQGPSETWGGVLVTHGHLTMDSTTIRDYGAGVSADRGSFVDLGLWPPSSGDKTIRLLDNDCGICASESSHVTVTNFDEEHLPILVLISNTTGNQAGEGRSWADVWASSGAYVDLRSGASISGTATWAAHADMNATVALGSTTIDKEISYMIDAQRRGFVDFGPVTFRSGELVLSCDASSAVTGKNNVPMPHGGTCTNLY
jgi:hypothetical protein